MTLRVRNLTVDTTGKSVFKAGSKLVYFELTATAASILIAASVADLADADLRKTLADGDNMKLILRAGEEVFAAASATTKTLEIVTTGDNAIYEGDNPDS